jgi:L,D-transpeptidase YcbB
LQLTRTRADRTSPDTGVVAQRSGGQLTVAQKRLRAMVLVVLALLASSDRQELTARSSEVAPGSQRPRSSASRDASGDFRSVIAALIDGRDAVLGVLSRDERSELQALYESADAPLWLEAAGRPTRNMQDAVMVLSEAASEGLDPADYYQDLIAHLSPRPDTGSSTAQDPKRLDVVLSTAMLRYLRDVHVGRVDPRTIGFRLDAPRDQHDFAALLRAAISERQVMKLADDLRPPLAQYRLLRMMLLRYRSLGANASVLARPAVAPSIHPGDSYADVGVLQQELIVLDDLPADTPAPQANARYDGPVVDGVKHFQIRHGLEPDGVVGKSTIAALRVPLAWRVRQIELALERLRWLPDLGDERLIVMNIPMFRLWAWDVIPPSGTPLFGMDVIVGRALSTQTPVFSEEMREVIFRPYWNVPRSILRHEVLPAIERDPGYLAREDMEIVRGESDNKAAHVELSAEALKALRRGTLRVRQRPGPKNALGLIKFVFPNEDDVYMHGTPAQALFGRSRRDFSHGCVRVADPVALAEWVLQDQSAWTRDRILAATMDTETIHVKLPRPIQVILFYTTTAVMPEDGTIRFADDIYRHDATLDRALAQLRQFRTRPASTSTN